MVERLKTVIWPKLRQLVRGRAGGERNDDVWRKCPACGRMIFHRDLEANLHVCIHCGHHLRLDARQRLALLFDEGALHPIDLPAAPPDPLKFRDRRKYADRLKDAQGKTGSSSDALVVAHGALGGMGVVMAALDFQFMGGTMGVAVGEGLLTAARLAVIQDAPMIVVTASSGARMQEGVLSLIQMARTTIAIEEVREAGLPYIVVLTDPTTGGAAASFAMLGDVTLAEPGAVIGLAVPTGRFPGEIPPDAFRRAEDQLAHGMIDMVVRRHDLRATLIRILRLLRNPGPTAEIVTLPVAVPPAAGRPREEEHSPE